MALKSNLISMYRQTIIQFLANVNELNALKAQWDALGYTASLTDADFQGANNDLVAQDLKNAATAMGAINTTINTGSNAAYLYKLVI